MSGQWRSLMELSRDYTPSPGHTEVDAKIQDDPVQREPSCHEKSSKKGQTWKGLAPTQRSRTPAALTSYLRQSYAQVGPHSP